jgi:hypothetical protein
MNDLKLRLAPLSVKNALTLALCPTEGIYHLFHDVLVAGTDAADTAFNSRCSKEVQAYVCSGKFVARENEFIFIPPTDDEVFVQNIGTVWVEDASGSGHFYTFKSILGHSKRSPREATHEFVRGLQNPI